MKPGVCFSYIIKSIQANDTWLITYLTNVYPENMVELTCQAAIGWIETPAVKQNGGLVELML